MAIEVHLYDKAEYSLNQYPHAIPHFISFGTAHFFNEITTAI
jgi:hypothetical protein